MLFWIWASFCFLLRPLFLASRGANQGVQESQCIAWVLYRNDQSRPKASYSTKRNSAHEGTHPEQRTIKTSTAQSKRPSKQARHRTVAAHPYDVYTFLFWREGGSSDMNAILVNTKCRAFVLALLPKIETGRCRQPEVYTLLATAGQP